MDAFLCKTVSVVEVADVDKSKEESRPESEPPLKKLKHDTCNEDDDKMAISMPHVDAEVAEKDEEKEETDVIALQDTSADSIGEEKTQSTNASKQGDSVSPPKQKRRKLTNEEKEALIKQKEEARLQREKLQLERQMEKERKEKEKEVLRQKREKEKQEKQAKKEQLEKERLEKQRKREEIIQAKEEEKKKKDEERKQKEDEKKKFDEERRLKEEEELKKKERAKSAFRSFFIKKTPPKKVATVGEDCKLFAPFEVKSNMTLAPAYRGKKVEDKCKFDEQCQNQDDSDLYLSILKRKCSKENMKYTTKRTLKPKNNDNQNQRSPNRTSQQTEDDVIVLESHSSPAKDLSQSRGVERETMRVKLLQFSENYRPAYYGTWRKRSKVISPKNPFEKDENHLNYEVDSDDEWEEEEPGESLSGPENDDEDEDDPDAGEDDEEDDGFFVPHGYLSDDEGIDESDGEKGEERVDVKDRKLDKTEGFPFDKKSSKAKSARAVCFGSSWFNSSDDSVPDFLVDYKTHPMLTLPIDVFEIRQKTQTVEKKSPTQQQTSDQASPACAYRGNAPMLVPEEAMHLLINHVHKSTSGLNKLTITFLDFWKRRQPQDETVVSYPQISKRQLEKKILEIAKRDFSRDCNKMCYFVHKDILDRYAAKLEDCQDDEMTGSLSQTNNSTQACKGLTSRGVDHVGDNTIPEFQNRDVPSSDSNIQNSKPSLRTEIAIA
eukprot:gene9620-10603_t